MPEEHQTRLGPKHTEHMGRRKGSKNKIPIWGRSSTLGGIVPSSEVLTAFNTLSPPQFASWVREQAPNSRYKTAAGIIPQAEVFSLCWGQYKAASALSNSLLKLLTLTGHDKSSPHSAFLTPLEVGNILTSQHQSYLNLNCLTPERYRRTHGGHPHPVATGLCITPLVHDAHYTTCVLKRTGTTVLALWYDPLGGHTQNIQHPLQKVVDALNRIAERADPAWTTTTELHIQPQSPPPQIDRGHPWSCGGHCLVSALAGILHCTYASPSIPMHHTQHTVYDLLQSQIEYELTGEWNRWVTHILLPSVRTNTTPPPLDPYPAQDPPLPLAQQPNHSGNTEPPTTPPPDCAPQERFPPSQALSAASTLTDLQFARWCADLPPHTLIPVANGEITRETLLRAAWGTYKEATELDPFLAALIAVGLPRLLSPPNCSFLYCQEAAWLSEGYHTTLGAMTSMLTYSEHHHGLRPPSRATPCVFPVLLDHHYTVGLLRGDTVYWYDPLRATLSPRVKGTITNVARGIGAVFDYDFGPSPLEVVPVTAPRQRDGPTGAWSCAGHMMLTLLTTLFQQPRSGPSALPALMHNQYTVNQLLRAQLHYVISHTLIDWIPPLLDCLSRRQTQNLAAILSSPRTVSAGGTAISPPPQATPAPKSPSAPLNKAPATMLPGPTPPPLIHPTKPTAPLTVPQGSPTHNTPMTDPKAAPPPTSGGRARQLGFAGVVTLPPPSPPGSPRQRQCLPPPRKPPRWMAGRIRRAKTMTSRRRRKQQLMGVKPIMKYIRGLQPQSESRPKQASISTRRTVSAQMGNLYTALSGWQVQGSARAERREGIPQGPLTAVQATASPGNAQQPSADTNLATAQAPLASPLPPGWGDCPLSLATLNVCKAGPHSPSLTDLHTLIEVESPDVLMLSETPYQGSSHALTGLLRRMGYFMSFLPPEPPRLDEEFLPPEARAPRQDVSGGGCLTAIRRSCPLSQWATKLRVQGGRVSRFISGIHISPPYSPPLLLVAVYLPQKNNMDTYRQCCKYLSDLCAEHPDATVIVGGDFQTPWEADSPAGQAIRSTPLGLIPAPQQPPTFNPPLAPETASHIDHLAYRRVGDILHPSAFSLHLHRSVYSDHHALVGRFALTGIPVQEEGTHAQPQGERTTQPRLALPLPPDLVPVWQDKFSLLHEADLHEISLIARDLQARHEAEKVDQAAMTRETRALSARLNTALLDALSLALAIFPHKRAPPTVHRRSRRPYWPRSLRTTLEDLRDRAKQWRRWVNYHHKKTVGGEEALRPETPLLFTQPPTSKYLPDHTPLNWSPGETQEEIPREVAVQGFKHTQKCIKKALKIRGAENRDEWAKRLLGIWRHRPKQAIKAVQAAWPPSRAGSTHGPDSLTRVIDPITKAPVSAPEQVLAAVEAHGRRLLTVPDDVTPDAPFPWESPSHPDPFLIHPSHSQEDMFGPAASRARYNTCLRRLACGKATGPDNIPAELIKALPESFHDALFWLFRLMTATGFTPPDWIHSHTVLIYKKGDPACLDNYRPIALASTLYKLWTGFVTSIATRYIEERQIIHRDQEGFRPGHSCARAVMHLQLTLEAAHQSGNDILLAYLDFKGAYPSVNHTQLRRTLEALGLPDDFTNLVGNLYAGATTAYITQWGATRPIPVGRGTLQGDPLSPLLFDLMIEPLVRWLAQGDRGCEGYPSSPGSLCSKWYADDGTLVTNTPANLRLQLEKVEAYGDWSGIKCNVSKCRLTGYIHKLQSLPPREAAQALEGMLADITIDDTRVPVVGQDEPLPGTYLGTCITASLSFKSHVRWARSTITPACEAVVSSPLPVPIKQQMLAYTSKAKLAHTHVMLGLTADNILALDSQLARYVKRIHCLPPTMATAAVHSPQGELGLGFPSIWEDYSSAASQVWLLLNDTGLLGEAAQHSLQMAGQRFAHWPVSLALSHCPFLLGRATSVLVRFGILPEGAPPMWQGNEMSKGIEAHCAPLLDSAGCQLKDHPYPPTETILSRISPLWDCGLLEWKDVLYALPGGRIRVISLRELTSRDPKLDGQTAAARALEYLQDLLSTATLPMLRKQRGRRSRRNLAPNEYRVHQRWRTMLPQPHLLPQEPTPERLRAARGLQPIRAFCQKGQMECPPRKDVVDTLRASVRHSAQSVRPPLQRAKRRRRRPVPPEPRLNPSGQTCLWPRVLRVTNHRRRHPHTDEDEGGGLEYLVDWAPTPCAPRHILLLMEAGMRVEGVTHDQTTPAALLKFTEGLRQPYPQGCQFCGLDGHTPARRPMRVCARCLCWSHPDCAQACAEAEGLTVKRDQRPQWTCPGCPANDNRCPLPDFVCLTSWEPSWMAEREVLSLDQGVQALEAFNDREMLAYRQKRQRSDGQGPAHLGALERLPAPRPTPPAHCPSLSSRTILEATELNPNLDIDPTGEYTANLVPDQNQQEQGRVSIHDPSGRAVSPYCLSLQRYLWLRAQHDRHAPPLADVHQDLARLLRRYHPRAKTLNPQGAELDLKNHWSVQLPLAEAMYHTFGTECELFSSPLNCSMGEGMAYCSPFQEDARFGAVVNSFAYRWTGSCVANPEYTAPDMRQAVEHAIRSSVTTDNPFLCLLTLPSWDDSPWRSAGLLSHKNVHHLLQVPHGRFRFVPATGHREETGVEPSSLPPAEWAVDLLLVANAAGMSKYVDMSALEHTLVPALRHSCDFKDLHVELFPPGRGLQDGALAVAQPRSQPPLPSMGLHPPCRSLGDPLWLRDPTLESVAGDVRPLPQDRPLVVVELCAGIATGLEALLKGGHYISSYTWADINPDAHTATNHRLAKLQQRFPLQLPPSAVEGWDKRLPFNCNCISPATLHPSFPDGIDLVIAGPPCQPYSTAGKHKGLGDPRSGALINTVRLICYLHASQSDGVRYIIENVPGTEKHPEIARMLGAPVKLDAPPCGSAARRQTLFWQNLAPVEEIQSKFGALPPPSQTVNGALKRAGLHSWRSQPQELGVTCFPGDPYNLPGLPQRAIPKMVCFKGSHAFRFKRVRGRMLPGPGMLYKGNELTEPDAEVAEALMGFEQGDTAAPGLLPGQRRHLLGQCIDINLFSWLIATASPRTELHPPPPGPRARHAVPEEGVRLWQVSEAQRAARWLGDPLPWDCMAPLSDAPGLVPSPPLEDATRALAVPPLRRHLAHDPRVWVYTDGSRSEASSTLGAAVVHLETNTFVRLACTGKEECNTVFRAELVGIHEAICHFSERERLYVLSDCASAIQAVDAAVRRPHERGYHHHRPLLHAIAQGILERDRSGKHTVIHKVRAHVGIEGNELADWHAKFAAKHPLGTEEFPVKAHTLGAAPARPCYWLFYEPGVPSPQTADSVGKAPAAREGPRKRKLDHLRGPVVSPDPTSPPPPPATDARPSASQENKGGEPDVPAGQPGQECGEKEPVRHAFTDPQKQIRTRVRPRVLEMTACNSLYRRLIMAAKQRGDQVEETAAGLAKLHREGRHRDATRIFKFLWGQYYNGKLARRYGHATHDKCPLCSLPDSCTHIGAGCPALAPHYLLRHQAAVQAMHVFIRQSEKGAGAILGNPLTLVACDGGGEAAASKDPTLRTLAGLEAHATSRQGPPRDSDPSLCLKECIHAPKYLPEWVLPKEVHDRLLAEGAGLAPDIVYARGVPNLCPPPPNSFNPCQCSLLLVEVGYCQDLRLDSKEQMKLGKYDSLVTALRERWGRVTLVGIPLGIGGTVSSSTAQELALALCLKRPNLQSAHRSTSEATHGADKSEDEAGEVDARALRATRKALKSLAKTLRSLAQAHLLHIMKARVCKMLDEEEPTRGGDAGAPSVIK